ncbi:outer membrane protein assembly factor BamA [Polaribacter sp. Z014]|uniref:outer membrane protein assembly factor BamA n=1 Tax=unclassified Polaribacter TaxID=196858 RepID=UPI00193B6264|nr:MULTISPECIES: outer membrane protein assembly factor BamA [unclassified Polaribacter]MCL7764271.1 outer membrane protein assembly factor BamA [Polaribacter sp. Z014]QVY65074.1 outer membrane protein assembly factor BamA [Polaribacter sp. Q13]
MKLFSATIMLTALFFTFSAKAQNEKDSLSIVKKDTTATKDLSFEKGKEYILGGMSVTGLKKFSEETVRVFTGLRNGQPLKLPGDKLTSAIKKLYESKQFSNVDVYLAKLDGNTIYLQFDVLELPQLNNVTITGIKKGKAKDLKKDAELKKGAMVTDNLIVTSKNYFTKKYTDKGYLKTKVNLDVKKDTSDINIVNMAIFIDKGKKIKIKDIIFKGNKALSSKKLRKAMKNTKEKIIGRFWKGSKYIEEDFQEDLESILDKYSRLGYRDARILSDKISWNDDNTININLDLEEGRQYRFAEILFVGNKEYTAEQLQQYLKIEKGDVYNGAVLEERVKGDGSPTSQDISTLYQDSGFLFSSVNAVETKVKNDSITVEIRIREDEKARIRKVTVSGNEKTNDHVLFRELRVKPGDLFSRSAIIRSIREIGQLGFFDSNVTPDVIPDYQNKTADIDFTVVEKGGSQIELQGGYGGGSFIGTLGLSFNNFSIRNIFNKEAYKPLPMGDGQTLSLRLQTSRTYNTYSFSFTEPWLGGKKPKSLSFSVYSSNQYQLDYTTYDVDKSKSLGIIGASVGLGQRLKWPDDYFQLSQSISYQALKSNDYNFGLAGLNLNNGTLNNLSYNISLTRNSAGPSLIFPTYGSEFTIGAKATFPYSLVNNKDYNDSNLDAIDKYKWLEYYKLNFKGKWYTSFTDKLVLMTNAEGGYLGSYNKDLGATPVERYFVGGDGIAAYQLDGRETVGLRGYENSGLSSNYGGTIYNKFQLELRYSITDAPSASIYTLGFLEAGNSYDTFKEFNPFDLKRSAGVGVRIFMPAFGLLGIDFAHGFDPLPGETEKSGWQTHFIIGKQF